MTTLSVRNFSCIVEADLKLARITTLIGPQASGKSVISKLVYFFYDILSSQYIAIEDGKKIEEFKLENEEKFKKWFPQSAWGDKRFYISFEAGLFGVKVERKVVRKNSRNKITIELSNYFVAQYEELFTSFQKRLDGRSGKESAEEMSPPVQMDLFWKLRESSVRKLRKDLGGDFYEYQYFVPAGRSFFTSIGKAVAAFERGGMLDPVTVQFGRYFASLRDSYSRRRWRPPMEKVDIASRKQMTERLFGGEIKFERDMDYVETSDGRIIPFSLLSSGQQELLPLWLMLENVDLWRGVNSPSRLIYIEEPEAHLFPSAQSLLTEYLSTLVSGRYKNVALVITTHSPYLLSKLNNLLKAGELGKRLGRTQYGTIGNVIRREAWLEPDSLAAYAIKDGRLHSLVGGDGLIDAEYLDEASGEISREFMELLEIEVRHGDR